MIIAVICCCYLNLLGVFKEQAECNIIKEFIPLVCADGNFSGRRCLIFQNVTVLLIAHLTHSFFKVGCLTAIMIFFSIYCRAAIIDAGIPVGSRIIFCLFKIVFFSFS